jgi:uncharacterized membrane protein
VTWLPLVTFIVSAWLAAGVFYQDLPNLIPTHWSSLGKADGYVGKPWGPFFLPLMMTIVWLARPMLRRISLPRFRTERFPGAFDFRVMLTIGLVFVIWSLVIAQSVSWLRTIAVPVSVALIVAGSFLRTMPFSSLNELGLARFMTNEVEWLRARRTVAALFIIAGAGLLAIVAVGV